MNLAPNPSAEPIDSRRLRVFVQLARSGGFTVAADDLKLTSSAISHSIKSLEEDMGCDLFERRNHRAVLTASGVRLLAYAERILGEMENARAELRLLNQWGRGELRIGAPASACQYFFRDVLLEFRECFPECVLDVVALDSRAAAEQLHVGAIDVAICVLGEKVTEVEVMPLFEDELVVVVSPRHSWAALSRVTARDLARQKLIVYSRDSITTGLVQNFLKQQGVILQNFMSLNSMEAIKELAKVGIGPGFVAEWVAERDLEAGTLRRVRVSGPRLRRQWVAMWRTNRQPGIMAETFFALCREATAAAPFSIRPK